MNNIEVSYRTQVLLAFHEHLVHIRLFGGTNVAHLFSLYGVVFCLFILVLCLLHTVVCISVLSSRLEDLYRIRVVVLKTLSTLFQLYSGGPYVHLQ